MASWKWILRGMLALALVVLAAGALVLYVWMRPEFIRSQVTSQLIARFYGTDVEVHSARLRLLGGVTVTDLKLIRRDDPTRTPILHVPHAVLHHDKEKLNEGRLVVRKVEMFKPTLILERDKDGKWTFLEIVKPPTDDDPLPIFLLHQANITLIDRTISDKPLGEWKDVDATIINDPLPVIQFQIAGNGKPSGPFQFSGKFDKRTGFAGSLNLSAIPLGSDVAPAVELCCPDLAELVVALSGRASAHMELVYRLGPTPTLYHDLKFTLQQGRFAHPKLPMPLEHIEAIVRSRNGDITIDKATARMGEGLITVSLDLPAHESMPSPVSAAGDDIERRLRLLDIAATNITVSPALFDMVPGPGELIREMFDPAGLMSMQFTYQRADGLSRKRMVLDPAGMSARYRGFPYPLKNVRGRVIQTAGEGELDHVEIDLLADGAGSTVSIRGTIRGMHPNADVNLTIAGKNITLDDDLINAMPDDQPALLRQLHARATGDFTAVIKHNEQIRRDYGPEVFANLFTINVHDASMTYEQFPYPLEKMTGTLIVKTVPDRPTRLPRVKDQPAEPQPNGDSTTLEFHNFRASRNGSQLRGSGRKDPAPGGSNLSLAIDCESLALDDDMLQALSAIHVDNAWRQFAPSGRVNVNVRTKLFVHSDPQVILNPADDLELSLAFAGGQVKPTFFPLLMHDLAGRVDYARGRVDIRDFKAKHASSEITLPTAEVLFRPSGGYWADLHDLRVNPLVIDREFLDALSPGLRAACEGLALKGPMALQASRLVIDEQPGPFIPRDLPGVVRSQEPPANEAVAMRPLSKPILPTIYWDGRLVLAGASLNTGIDWENVHGSVASWGLYKGDRLGAVRGNLQFDKANVAKQPMEAINASLRVDPRQPDILSVPNIRGKLYGGEVGGEAWVMMDSPTRYALQLNAARIRLSEIAREHQLPPKARLEGLANAQIYLTNRPDERTGKLTMQGGGTIDVPNGKMLNLPVMLNLIKVVKLRVPDDTGFEEAHASFYIRGDRLKFGQLDLIGNAVSLGGEGEMKMDGSDVRFEFYPVWTKMKEMFALPGDWTGAISRKFLKIKVTGDLEGKLDYRAEPVPGIVDPVKRVIDRLK